jgi:hypothetical protein
MLTNVNKCVIERSSMSRAYFLNFEFDHEQVDSCERQRVYLKIQIKKQLIKIN